VFGELHGTREAPEFIARLSCGLAHTGKRILVAIEHEATDNAALQLAWRLPNQSFPAALRKIGWDWRDDGRGSQAMFDMIVQLHRLKTEGRTVDLVAFNGFSDEEQRKRFSYRRPKVRMRPRKPKTSVEQPRAATMIMSSCSSVTCTR
jgi:hypothetical protein